MKKPQILWHWAPRLLCILAILFISLFALDSFEPGLTLAEQIGGFAIHMIPSVILTVLLLIAWKWELAGGIIFILISLIFTPVLFLGNLKNNGSVWTSFGIVLMIVFPFFLTGVLFLLSRKAKMKSR